MSNQECKARPVIININSNEHSFYPYIINAAVVIIIYNVSYAKLYVPDVVKNINNNAINLMQNINETRHVFWHETSTCKCRLDASVCNNKQRWDNDKCSCECK